MKYRLIKHKNLSVLNEKIARLESQITSAQSFIKEIETGNLSIQFEKVLGDNGDDNPLGTSLLSMRDQMSKIADEEKRRNWTTEGLAKFVDILRGKNDDLKALGEMIISNVVKYMNANQGALYIVNENQGEDQYLELIGCYAYDRKKHRTQKIGLGEGLAGQAVLEKGMIYMTNLPDNYLKITSGLGEALPKNLLIMPLLMNDKAYGVVELASFSPFEDHHRDFIQKLAESIASTISNVRVNQQTRKLLQETQAQAEMMRSQEEEMRQNMEELTATQEEMQRVLKEVQGKESYLNELLNASTDSIFTVDRNLKLISWNKVFEATQRAGGISVSKGFDILGVLSEKERKANLVFYERALNGETFELSQTLTLYGNTIHFLIGYSPLRSATDELFAVAVFAKDITKMVEAQNRAEQLMNEAQQQAEEMKAQEEELRQNMEELSATQEEMHRVLKEVQSKETYLNELINASKDSIFTVDRDLRLLSWNKVFQALQESGGLKVEKGLNTMIAVAEEQRKQITALYERAFKGEVFEIDQQITLHGKTMHFLIGYTPMRNEKQEVTSVAVFAKDITKIVEAQNKAEQLKNEAQHQAEELKAQEEELRQNMEELASTQEEMQRILTAVQAKETYLNELINASKDSIFTVDRNLRLVSWNRVFQAIQESGGLTVQKGSDSLGAVAESERKHLLPLYERAFEGEAFEISQEITLHGRPMHFLVGYSPMRNDKGEVTSVAVFAKDITEMVNAQKTAEKLKLEAQAKTEEIQRIVKSAEAKEAYVNELLNASDDMVFTVDRDYKLLSWNKTFAASMEQYQIQMSKGSNTLDWYPDETQRTEQKKMYERAFNGESFDVTINTAINSESHSFRQIYKPLRNEEGEVYQVAVFARDVKASDATADAELTRDVEHKEMFIQEVINGFRYDVYIVDRNFRFVNFNQSFVNTLKSAGIKLQHGTHALDIIQNKKERESVRKQLERAFKGESFDYVQEFSNNGMIKHIWIHYKPIRNLKNEVIAAGIYSEDITELITVKRLNSELLKQVQSKN